MKPTETARNDIDFETYKEMKCTNHSALLTFAKSPAHFKYYHLDGNEKPATPAMELGTAIHEAILAHNSFKEAYVVWDESVDKRTKEGKKQWEELKATGKKILTLKDGLLIRSILDSVEENETVKDLLLGCMPELSIIFNDEKTGLLCKARLDGYRDDGTIFDIKTTTSASESDFRKSLVNYSYFTQAAFYKKAVESQGMKFSRFVFIAIEKEAPHAIALYELSNEAIRQGEALNDKRLKQLAECFKTDTWPAYPKEIITIDLPVWAQNYGETLGETTTDDERSFL
jgi:hypothetical protein